MKSLRFTGHKMEASEFLIPMVDFIPPSLLPSVITQVMPVFIYKHCACVSLVQVSLELEALQESCVAHKAKLSFSPTFLVTSYFALTCI